MTLQEIESLKATWEKKFEIAEEKYQEAGSRTHYNQRNTALDMIELCDLAINQLSTEYTVKDAYTARIYDAILTQMNEVKKREKALPGTMYRTEDVIQILNQISLW